MQAESTVFIVDPTESNLQKIASALGKIGIESSGYMSWDDFSASSWKDSACCVLLSMHMEAEDGRVAGGSSVLISSAVGTRFPKDRDLSAARSGKRATATMDALPTSVAANSVFEFVAQIVRADATVPVMLMSANAHGQLVRQGFLAGAYDFLMLPIDDKNLQHIVSTALARKNRRREIDADVPVDQETRAQLDNLTPREFEVLGEMLRGMSIKQLAVRFEVSIQTAAKHRARVLNKMRIENEVQLIHLLGRR